MSSNTVLTTDLVTKEGARILTNSLSYSKIMNRDFESKFKGPVDTGTSIRIPKPAQWPVRKASNTFSSKPMIETYSTLEIGAPDGIDTTITQAEMDMSLDNFSGRVLNTQMPRLASSVDGTLINLGAKYAKSYQSAASTSLAYTDVAYLRARLVEQCLPKGEQLHMFCNPIDQVQLLGDTKGLFQNSNEIAGQYVDGMMGKFGGFNWVETNMLETVTPPADVAGTVNQPTAVVNGASTLDVDAFGATDVVPASAIVTIAGCYAINPETKATLPHLKPFRLDSATTMVSNAGTFTFTEPMYDNTDSRQNVSALPADGAVVTIIGTASTAYQQNLGTHKDAFTIAFVDMDVPNGTDLASKMTHEGVTLRFVREWDFEANTWKSRFDVQYGGIDFRPEWSGILSNF